MLLGCPGVFWVLLAPGVSGSVLGVLHASGVHWGVLGVLFVPRLSGGVLGYFMLLGYPGVLLALGVPQGCPEGTMCLCGVASVSLLALVISVLRIKQSCQGLPLRVSVASKELSKGTALSLTPATQSVPFSAFL